MPQSITIPSSLDDAKQALGELGTLITARKWERAAIVAAFVRLDTGHGGRETDTNTRFVSAREFAAFGIVGLLTHRSVSKYVQAWLDVNDGKYPKPGSTRRLPNSDFPPADRGTDGYNTEEGAATTIERIARRHGPAVIATALTNLPDAHVEEIVAAAHHDRPTVAQRGSTRAVREQMETIHPGITTRTKPVKFGSSALWMDAEREIGNIHHSMTMLHQLHGRDPEMMRHRADEIAREAEFLRILAELCRGVSTTDLDEALAAWAGE